MKKKRIVCPAGVLSRLRILALGIGILGVAGCATKPIVRKPIFYPPAPDEPRIQYLTSFSTSADIEPPPNRLLTFLTGYKGKVRSVLKPYGVAVANGRIFLCDTYLGCLCVFDLEHGVFSYFTPRGPGAIGKPINADVDADRNLYVADVERRRVVKFDAQGQYLTAITGNETFRPVDVVARGEKVYVVDTGGRKVRVYDRTSGTELLVVPAATATNVSEELYVPINADVDDDGNIYVADAAAFRVQIYDPEGQRVKSIGSQGTGFGEFARPKGIALDRGGRMYIVDAAAQLVQVFDVKTSALLMYFGDPEGSEVPLSLPAGIAIDYDSVQYFQKYADPGFEVEYLVLVTSQYGSPRVSIYGFGHRKQ